MIFILKSLHWAIQQHGLSCQATTSTRPLFCVRGFNVWGGGFKAHFKVAFVAALKQHWQPGRQGHEHGYIKKKSMVFTLVMVTACVMFNTGYERHWDPVAGIVIIICERLLRSLSIRWNNNNY